MKKKFIVAALIMSIMLLVLGCTSTKAEEVKIKTEVEMQELKPLTVGVMPDVDSIPVEIALANGYFEEEGLTLFIEHFRSALDRDAAYQTGNIDGAVSDMLAIMFLKEGGFDVKITSKTNGSFKLLSSSESNIKSVSDIDGNTVGISSNTIIDYLTDKMLLSGNNTVDSVKREFIPKIPVRLEMLKSSQIDLATLPEPLASVAVLGGANVISTSEELGINTAYFIFNQETIDHKTEEIKAFYRGYNRAVDYINTHDKSEFIDTVIENAGFPPVVKDTLILPTYTKASLPTEEDASAVFAWLNSKNLIDTEYNLSDLSTDMFVK